MTLITQHERPAEHAPTVFFNHCGRMPWSGRHDSAFTGLELVELLQFCKQEGHRQGRIDAIQSRVGHREEAPFHQGFMGGYPKALWERSYWDGVGEQGDPTIAGAESDIQEALADPGSSHWLRDALTTAGSRDCVDAANDAEHLWDLLRRRANAIAIHGMESSTTEADEWP